MIPLIASIGSFIPGLFGKKLTYKAAKIGGYIVIAVMLMSLLSLGKCAYDKSVVNDYQVQQQVKAIPAIEKAAETRAQDTIANTKSEEELNHVIEAAPKSTVGLSPAAHALSCERLRRIGRRPAGC